MKKLSLIMLVVLSFAAAANARYISAEWNSWTVDYEDDTAAIMNADYVTSDPVLENMIADAVVFFDDLDGNPYDPAPGVWDQYEGRTDVLEITGDFQLVFDLDNYSGGDYKEMLIEITYFDNGVYSDVYPVGQSDGTEVTDVVYGGYEIEAGWVTEYWQIIYEPNPEWEAIGINFTDYDFNPSYPAYIDSVFIQTECVPEPATLGLIAAGALAMIRRRK